MSIDYNEVALNKYMNEVEQEEINYEACIEAIAPLVEELLSTITNYGYDANDVCDFVRSL